MKFIWQADDIAELRRLHCASGTYMIARINGPHNEKKHSDIEYTLVNVESGTINSEHENVLANEVASILNELEAWPDGVDHNGQASLRDA